MLTHTIHSREYDRVVKQGTHRLHMIIHDTPGSKHEPGKGEIGSACLNESGGQVRNHVITAISDEAPKKICHVRIGRFNPSHEITEPGNRVVSFRR